MAVVVVVVAMKRFRPFPKRARRIALATLWLPVCALLIGMAPGASGQSPETPLRLPPPVGTAPAMEPAPLLSPGLGLPPRDDPGGSGPMTSTLPRASSPGLPGIDPLPPVGGGGPVVLDMPYEPLPSASDDGYLIPGAAFPEGFDDLWAPRPWSWQLMPNNLIYTSYLAGPKEPRFGTVWYDDTTPPPYATTGHEGWLWDSTLGGRASIARYGSDPVLHPQGFEVQIEGAAFVRLDPQDDRDLRSADYRFGIPVVYGVGRWQTKLAYYHNSAHLGDEFMLKHPTFPRINYVRDCIVWGNSYYLYDWMRLYGEVGWAFFTAGGAEPWEFQGASS